VDRNCAVSRERGGRKEIVVRGSGGGRWNLFPSVEERDRAAGNVLKKSASCRVA